MAMTSSRRNAVIHPSGAQIRAARALVGLSAAELADQSGVSLNTVKRAEAAAGLIPLTTPNTEALVRALAAAGVTFLMPGADGGAGVRLTREGTD